MADTPIAVNAAKATFDALTTDLRPKVMVDNIFVDTPFWLKLRQNLRPVSGRSWMPSVQLKKLDGHWYTRGGEIGTDLADTFSGQIATSAQYELTYWAIPVQIPAQDVDLQGANQLVDVLMAYTNNAVESVRSALSTAVFDRNETTIGTGGVANALETLDKACWYGNTYGVINPATSGQETWEAHSMGGETEAAVIVATAPSFDNLSHQVRMIANTTGEKPDLILTTEDVWSALRAQITANDYATAKAVASNSDVVKWGFDALWVNGVPIVDDRDCYGKDFVADQATQVLAKGHDAYFINFKHFKMAYNQPRAFKWHEDGWDHVRPKFDSYLNMFYVWVGTGTDARRTLGRQINIDPTMLEANFTLGTVRNPNDA